MNQKLGGRSPPPCGNPVGQSFQDEQLTSSLLSSFFHQPARTKLVLSLPHTLLYIHHTHILLLQQLATRTDLRGRREKEQRRNGREGRSNELKDLWEAL